MLRRLLLACAIAVTAAVTVPPAAQAATTCAEPAATWQRATPGEAGMDAARLEAAVKQARDGGAFAVRIYRHGCLVAEDANPASGATPTQSFSAAKSVVSLAFGRAQQLGLISPDDPVGSLFPQAGAEHGKRTLRHLLTLTFGNSQNLTRDFNILMADRIRDGLTNKLKHPPGEYWNYWQTGSAMVAEAVGRAAGEDFQAFLQRELFTPIGIDPGSWVWTRDLAGHTAGFWGIYMVADDYARFGELLRRDGVWNGKRLLSDRYVREAVQPSEPYGCYGFLIWTDATRECNGQMLGLPRDMFQYSGLLGQLITVFPSQGVVTVRTGVDAVGWNQRQFHDMVLGAITDTPVATPHLPPDPSVVHRIEGYEPFEREPVALVEGVVQPPLPPAGPWRARATVIGPSLVQADPSGQVTLTLSCPPRWLSGTGSCTGTAELERTVAAVAHDMAAGAQQLVQFQLTGDALSDLQSAGSLTLRSTATNRDGTPAGTRSTLTVTVTAG
jgi:CubicO group peptidase (beta-lactamase class C family)